MEGKKTNTDQDFEALNRFRTSRHACSGWRCSCKLVYRQTEKCRCHPWWNLLLNLVYPMLHIVPRPPLGWQDMGHQTTEEVPGGGEGRGQKVNAVSTERVGVTTVFNIGGLVSDKPFVIKATATICWRANVRLRHLLEKYFCWLRCWPFTIQLPPYIPGSAFLQIFLTETLWELSF